MEGMTDVWFSAQLCRVCFVGAEGGVTSETCVHLLRATGRDEAFARAQALGHDSEHEMEYLNGADERVQWRFDRVVTLDELGTGNLDGREVHSQFHDLDPPLPSDTVFDPASVEPGVSGVGVELPGGRDPGR